MLQDNSVCNEQKNYVKCELQQQTKNVFKTELCRTHRSFLIAFPAFFPLCFILTLFFDTCSFFLTWGDFICWSLKSKIKAGEKLLDEQERNLTQYWHRFSFNLKQIDSFSTNYQNVKYCFKGPVEITLLC